MSSPIHPELNALLEKEGDAPVQAVIQLRPGGKLEAAPSADEFVALADSVLDRVSAEVGHTASRTNLLKNLATLIVEADADFVRSLVHQPEVISAIPNATEQSPFIPPIEKKPE